jgi:hypothetical protein
MKLNRLAAGAAPFLLVTCAALAQPANNNLASATGVSFPTTGVSGTTIGATRDGPTAACADIGAGLDVWYRFTTPTAQSVTVDLCNGTDYDSLLQVFLVGAGNALGAQVACDDDACGSLRSRLSFTSTAGASYYVRVTGYNGATGNFIVRAFSTGTPPPPPPPEVTQSYGPDVTIGNLSDVGAYGSATVGGVSISAFAVGTDSWNIGDRPAVWYASDTRHPVIGQQMYRLSNGRFEQLGLSWVKHGFLATNSSTFEDGMAWPTNENRSCTPAPAGGAELGINCSDLYGAGLNASRSYLGPRYDINAITGNFTYPWSTLVNGYTPPGTNVVARRLQVKTSDLVFGGGNRYFVDAVYVTPDDAKWNNGRNNYSARELVSNGPDGGEWAFSGTTVRRKTALDLWPTIDSAVRLATVDFHETTVSVNDALATPPVNIARELQGQFKVASKATDLGNGTWSYEYAVLNVNSHRGLSGFFLRAPLASQLSSRGFANPLYHDGDRVDNSPWLAADQAGVMGWTTNMTFPGTVTIPGTAVTLSGVQPGYLYWGAMNNYRFVSTRPPVMGYARLRLGRGPADATGFQGSLLVAPGLSVPSFCLADIAGPGQTPGADGETTADDIITFIGAFTAGNQLVADIAGPGQSPLPDGELTADDVIVFVSAFTASCD